jgi:hypothetical protein
VLASSFTVGVWFENQSARGNERHRVFRPCTAFQEWLQDYRNAEHGEPLSRMKRAYAQPASDWRKRGLRSTSVPSHDLVDALFRNTKVLSEAGSGFSRFVPCNDFGVTVSFFGCVVRLRDLRERRVVGIYSRCAMREKRGAGSRRVRNVWRMFWPRRRAVSITEAALA